MPDCQDPPSPELLRAVAQFNRREFFECHETLEALWLAEPGMVRRVYQGILQVGVGFLHLLRGNYAGATGVLANGLARLEAFGPVCLGLDIAGLCAEAARCQAEILRLGPAGLKDFDLELLPEIRFVADRPS
jgi:predicted metal-dependent hydrolase